MLNNMFVRDTMADVLKISTCLISAVALLFVWPYLRDRGLYKGEVSVLVLFAVLGMMLLISAGSLIMVYLGLELLALKGADDAAMVGYVNRVNDDGRIYVTQGRPAGRVVMRFQVGSFACTEADVELAGEVLHELAGYLPANGYFF